MQTRTLNQEELAQLDYYDQCGMELLGWLLPDLETEFNEAGALAKRVSQGVDKVRSEGLVFPYGEYNYYADVAADLAALFAGTFTRHHTDWRFAFVEDSEFNDFAVVHRDNSIYFGVYNLFTNYITSKNASNGKVASFYDSLVTERSRAELPPAIHCLCDL